MIKMIFKELGVMGVLRVIVYPLTTLATTPVQLFRTIYNCRVLLSGRWSSYNGYAPSKGFNNLFYWTQALNIDKYGINGQTPSIGLGRYNLLSWFHLTLPSLYLYWKFSALVVPLGMLAWLVSHFVWLRAGVDVYQLGIVLLFLFFSVTFYSQAFIFQNYNVLGWSVLPVTLYCIACTQWVEASICLLVISFFSITVVFFTSALLIYLAILGMEMTHLLLIIPAASKLCLSLVPVLRNRKSLVEFSNILRGIGFSMNKPKYIRKKKDFHFVHVYFVIIYIQFVLFNYVLIGKVDYLMLFALGIYLFNTYLIRLADRWSVYLLGVTLASTSLIMDFNYYLLASFWLVISPLPGLAGSRNNLKFIDKLPELKPFRVGDFIKDVEHFLSPVNKGDRIFMCHKDPGNSYDDLFNGYCQIKEILLYVATKKEFLIFPDWYAVAETNYEGAPDIWGTEIEKVTANAKAWSMDYVIISESDSAEDKAWLAKGFSIIGELNWKIHKDLNDNDPIPIIYPQWKLLKFNESC